MKLYETVILLSPGLKKDNIETIIADLNYQSFDYIQIENVELAYKIKGFSYGDYLIIQGQSENIGKPLNENILRYRVFKVKNFTNLDVIENWLNEKNEQKTNSPS